MHKSEGSREKTLTAGEPLDLVQALRSQALKGASTPFK
jgi:hypothetical protein